MSGGSPSRRGLLALLAATPWLAPRAAARAPREPVLLLKTRVNGEFYYQASESLATLAPGDPLTLRREPGNAYDKRAIEVLDAAGRKLGYVPHVDNPAVARMMDAGERITARAVRVDAQAWDIRIEVEWLRG